MPLEPLPETREALLDMSRWTDRDLVADLVRQAESVEDIVPNLVGLSLAVIKDDLTFTVAASKERLALLDAIQYALGGPCVDAAQQDAIVLSGDNDAGLFDEQRWAEFARAGAAHGVLSTLSMPVHADGRVVAGVNLYAATPNSFRGREERLAEILGAWAPGAVHNADMSFTTREAARRAPQTLEDRNTMNQATGVVMTAHGVDRQTARQMITDAAHRAGQDEFEVARALIRPFLEPETGP